MRRKDREMDIAFAEKVIDQSRYGVLSILEDVTHSPYSIPLSIVREDKFLFFHSAREGTKVDLFSANDQVRVVFVGEVHVPNLFTTFELDEMVKDKEKTAQLIRNVFTTEFESAIVEGKIEEVINVDEKIHALQLICQKYTPDKMAYFQYAVQAGEKYTRIYRISMDTVKAKRKKYNSEAKEKVYSYSITEEETFENVFKEEKLLMNHVIVPPGKVFPKHPTDATVYALITQGELSVTIEEKETQIYKAGQLVNIPKGADTELGNRGEDFLELFVVKFSEFSI